MPVSRFQWADGGAQSLVLDLHVQNQTLEQTRSLFPARSLDKAVLEVVSVGSGINEVSLLVRHERDDTGLRGLQDAAKRGLEFTYTPDNDVPGTTFTVKAVRVGQISLEAEGRQDMFSLPLTLARLDGGVFSPDV